MAAMEDDMFFDALQKHCTIIESALLSKCNMNHQLREEPGKPFGLKEAIATQITPRPSYASVVARSVAPKDKEKSRDYCLVVDSDNCSSDDVRKIIKSKINPAESKLELQEKSPELKASLPKRRNTAIIVKNGPNEVSNEDLLNVISEQNPEIVVDDESIGQCRVRFTLKTFQHTRHVVIETHPIVLNQSYDKQD
ncbi:hypothetical protein TNCT_234141 [Trichonephila clavata]|uniref:Uncharacterized protein n=1 Tax=Trichonephila clavata TaxID=2740835 RepID=A0A8X6FWH4_TRICU|nr:hypothetical protein TNCT_234141 [Trichonephila clavata]